MVRTFIYGSCVSRDTFEHLDKSRYSLLKYAARSTLASAFAKPTDRMPSDLDSLSAFQRRQICDDFLSLLPQTLRKLHDSIDLLLWDLTDERLGFYIGPDGQIVSDSLELRKLGKEVLDSNWRRVAFGSDQHFALFGDALPSWRAALEEHELLAKTLLLAPPWASQSTDRSPAPTSFGVAADQANEAYQRYYDEIRVQMGVPILGRDLMVATDKGHIWGAAPFHYCNEVYQALVLQIEARMNS